MENKTDKEISRANLNFIEFCEEIDSLKEEVKYWKQKYKQEVQERNDELNERLVQTKKDIGNALLFALAVKDDENGNLVISKEERKQLVKSWKTKR